MGDCLAAIAGPHVVRGLAAEQARPDRGFRLCGGDTPSMDRRRALRGHSSQSRIARPPGRHLGGAPLNRRFQINSQRHRYEAEEGRRGLGVSVRLSDTEQREKRFDETEKATGLFAGGNSFGPGRVFSCLTGTPYG